MFSIIRTLTHWISPSHRVPASLAKDAAVLLGVVAMLTCASRAEAQCLQCTTATDQATFSTSAAWGFGCVPGFVLADDNADGTASISMTIGANSLQLLQTFTSSTCCVAPYANIGIFDACQASDQWNQPGSHLPIQLKDLAMLNGAWTFQVPYPLNPDWTIEQYRVYYEIFLSTTSAGHADGGNLTLVFFWSNYSFDTPTGHAPINGSQGMDVIDYHGQVGVGQGPFVDFLFPQGTYAPDSNGVVTVPSTDVKAVLDWAVANFPNYYTSDLYLSSLSLAEEAAAFHGTVTTTYASFAVQKTGSDVVFTPPFTSGDWNNCTSATDCDDGNPCTTDDCVSNLCSHVAVAGCGDAGTTASDGGGPNSPVDASSSQDATPSHDSSTGVARGPDSSSSASTDGSASPIGDAVPDGEGTSGSPSGSGGGGCEMAPTAKGSDQFRAFWLVVGLISGLAYHRSRRRA